MMEGRLMSREHLSLWVSSGGTSTEHCSAVHLLICKLAYTEKESKVTLEKRCTVSETPWD